MASGGSIGSKVCVSFYSIENYSPLMYILSVSGHKCSFFIQKDS